MTTPHPDTWLTPMQAGLYCAPGDFFIDPLRPVPRAIITHAHSDHARPGPEAVLASPPTLALMRARLGEGAGEGVRHLEAGARAQRRRRLDAAAELIVDDDAADAAALALCHLAMSPALSGANTRISRRVAS